MVMPAPSEFTASRRARSSPPSSKHGPPIYLHEHGRLYRDDRFALPRLAANGVGARRNPVKDRADKRPATEQPVLCLYAEVRAGIRKLDYLRAECRVRYTKTVPSLARTSRSSVSISVVRRFTCTRRCIELRVGGWDGDSHAVAVLRWTSLA